MYCKGLSEKQKITLPDGLKAKSATMAGQYLLVLVEDGDARLYTLSDTGALVAREMPENVTDRRIACLYRDPERKYPQRQRRRRPVIASGGGLPATGDHAVVDGSNNDDDIYGEPSTSTSLHMPILQDKDHEGALSNGNGLDVANEGGHEDATWLCTCSDRGGMAVSGCKVRQLVLLNIHHRYTPCRNGR